jgi:hypothetical protein
VTATPNGEEKANMIDCLSVDEGRKRVLLIAAAMKRLTIRSVENATGTALRIM